MTWFRCGGGNGGGGDTCLIASSGAQEITLPIKASENLKFKIEMYYLYATTDKAFLGDTWQSSGWHLYARNTAEIGMRYGTGNSYGSWAFDYWKKNIIEVDLSDVSLKINGTTVTSGHTQSFSSGENIKMFGVTTGGGGYAVACLGVTEIYKDGNLYMKLIPKRNAQTGAGYYYDEINNVDYYSETATDLICMP